MSNPVGGVGPRPAMVRLTDTLEERARQKTVVDQQAAQGDLVGQTGKARERGLAAARQMDRARRTADKLASALKRVGAAEEKHRGAHQQRQQRQRFRMPKPHDEDPADLF